jgi:hypothetical protein
VWWARSKHINVYIGAGSLICSGTNWQVQEACANTSDAISTLVQTLSKQAPAHVSIYLCTALAPPAWLPLGFDKLNSQQKQLLMQQLGPQVGVGQPLLLKDGAGSNACALVSNDFVELLCMSLRSAKCKLRRLQPLWAAWHQVSTPKHPDANAAVFVDDSAVMLLAEDAAISSRLTSKTEATATVSRWLSARGLPSDGVLRGELRIGENWPRSEAFVTAITRSEGAL